MKKLLILLGASALTFTLAVAEGKCATGKCAEGKCGVNQKTEKKCVNEKCDQKEKCDCGTCEECKKEGQTTPPKGKCAEGKCGQGKCG